MYYNLSNFTLAFNLITLIQIDHVDGINGDGIDIFTYQLSTTLLRDGMYYSPGLSFHVQHRTD